MYKLYVDQYEHDDVNDVDMYYYRMQVGDETKIQRKMSINSQLKSLTLNLKSTSFETIMQHSVSTNLRTTRTCFGNTNLTACEESSVVFELKSFLAVNAHKS